MTGTLARAVSAIERILQQGQHLAEALKANTSRFCFGSGGGRTTDPRSTFPAGVVVFGRGKEERSERRERA